MHWEKPGNNRKNARPEQEGQNSRRPDPARPRRSAVVFLWAAGVFLLLLLSGFTWLWSYAGRSISPSEDRVVLIPGGAGLRGIQAVLSKNGILADDVRFLLLARMTGTSSRLQAGEYLVPAGSTPLRILRQMERGEVLLHRVTIPEGKTMRQVAGILAAEQWIAPDRFLALATDPDFIASLGFKLDTLEGYLFPDTYSLARGTVTEEKIILMMSRRFQEVWKELAPEQSGSLNRHEVVTLASIVEKETGMAAERPLVARVFLNRLEKNMRLQSDPTVIYGLDDFDGELRRADLRAETPYNTYVVRGLPPGPICNPGRHAILAVLQPADAPYLYFVSKNNGSHHFSTTLGEHNRAVREYRASRAAGQEE